MTDDRGPWGRLGAVLESCLLHPAEALLSVFINVGSLASVRFSDILLQPKPDLDAFLLG